MTELAHDHHTSSAISTVLDHLLGPDASAGPEYNAALEALLPAEVWATTTEPVLYGSTASYNNLYREMGPQFRGWLVENGVGLSRYSQAVGPIQYHSVRAELRTVFPSVRGNRGWKLRILGFPALQLVIFGLSHHYNDETSQNRLAAASQRLRAQALTVLPAGVGEVAESYQSATREDWDEDGLMDAPILRIGDLDISTYNEGEGAKLRYVRNTTAKKDIACFFFIGGYSRPSTTLDEQDIRRDSSAAQMLLDMKAIAEELGKE